MKKTAPVTWIHKVCHRCGQFLLIHEDTVWNGEKTYHYGCWVKEKEKNSRKKQEFPDCGKPVNR